MIGDDRIHLVQIRHMREGLNAELTGIGEENDLIRHSDHPLLDASLQLVGFTDSALQMNAFAGEKYFIHMIRIQRSLGERTNEGQGSLRKNAPGGDDLDLLLAA